MIMKLVIVILNNSSSYNNSFIKEKLNIGNTITKNVKKEKTLEKYRFYSKGGAIGDSFDETESNEELDEDEYLISPNTMTFLIYDMIIFFASLYSLILIPYEMTDNCIFIYRGKTNF